MSSNAAPNSKDQNNAFEIALTAAGVADWDLCRQALDFFFTDAPIGKEPDSPPEVGKIDFNDT